MKEEEGDSRTGWWCDVSVTTALFLQGRSHWLCHNASLGLRPQCDCPNRSPTTNRPILLICPEHLLGGVGNRPGAKLAPPSIIYIQL